MSHHQLGQLDRRIALFINLEELNLKGNSLSQLPSKFNQLTKLKRLNLQWNHFTEIPIQIKALKSLEQLNFKGNYLGLISQKNLDRYEAVRTLWEIPLSLLSFKGRSNKPTTLTGLVINIFCMAKGLLAQFSLKNSITGEKKNEHYEKTVDILSALPNLQKLSLSANHLDELPLRIGDLSHLGHLDLTLNNLLELPSSFSQLKNLTYLDLSETFIKNFPTGFKDLNLEVIRLASTFNFHFQVLEELTKLKKLKELDLSKNILSGDLRQWPHFTQLEYLSLRNSNLYKWPEGLENQETLKGLDLYHNSLKEIPEGISRLSKIKYMDLSRNELTSLPATFGQLSQLEALSFSWNHLNRLPDTFHLLKNLKKLGLAGGNFKSSDGSILFQEVPAQVYQLKNLKELDVDLSFKELQNHRKKFPNIKLIFNSDDLFSKEFHILQEF